MLNFSQMYFWLGQVAGADEHTVRQSLEYAEDDNTVMVILAVGNGDGVLYAIAPLQDQDFYMASYAALDDAIEVCETMGWDYIVEAKAVPSLARNKQVGGNHYEKLDIQPWDALENWLGVDGFRSYLRGNAVKYLCRAGSKGSARTDYAKAKHHLEELLSTYGSYNDE
jgi:hypothetical protein